MISALTEEMDGVSKVLQRLGGGGGGDGGGHGGGDGGGWW